MLTFTRAFFVFKHEQFAQLRANIVLLWEVSQQTLPGAPSPLITHILPWERETLLRTPQTQPQGFVCPAPWENLGQEQGHPTPAVPANHGLLQDTGHQGQQWNHTGSCCSPGIISTHTCARERRMLELAHAPAGTGQRAPGLGSQRRHIPTACRDPPPARPHTPSSVCQHPQTGKTKPTEHISCVKQTATNSN